MRTIGSILVLLGILLAGVGGYLFVREQLFLLTAEQTVAVVTGNESVNYTVNINEFGVQHYYCSAFQFQTRDGQTISFKETDGKLNRAGCAELNSAPDFKVGQELTVYYDPRDPANSAQIPKLVKKYHMYALVFALIGLLPVSIGVFFLWESEQNRKREAAKQQKLESSNSVKPNQHAPIRNARETKKIRK